MFNKKIIKKIDRLWSLVFSRQHDQRWFKIYSQSFTIEDHLYELEDKIDSLIEHFGLEYKLEKKLRKKESPD